MTFEEHTKMINDIRKNHTDEGQISVLLANLSEDYNKTLAEQQEKERMLKELEQKNESLRQANLDLFLKIGHNVENQQETKDSNNESKMSFDALFDENGKLI